MAKYSENFSLTQHAQERAVATPRRRLWRDLSGALAGLLVLAAAGLLAPRLMQGNLDLCLQQYAIDHQLPGAALTRDLQYQPEFNTAMALCAAPHP